MSGSPRHKSGSARPIGDGIRFAHVVTVQDVDVAAARVIGSARVGTVATAAIVPTARVGTVPTVVIVAAAVAIVATAIVGRRTERRAGCKPQSGAIVAVPATNPFTIPDVDPTEALVLLLLHKPTIEVSTKVMLDPTHTLLGPVIGAGVGLNGDLLSR